MCTPGDLAVDLLEDGGFHVDVGHTKGWLTLPHVAPSLPLTVLCSPAANAPPMDIYQVTNDIFTREDAEFLTKNSALEEGR